METEREPLLLQVLRTYNHRLRNLRKDKGYTLRELSELSKVSIQTISDLERLQQIPKNSTLEKIAKVLGTIPEYIFDENLKKLIELKFPHKISRIINEERFLDYNRREMLRIEEGSLPERNLLLEERTIAINEALSTLTPREKEIIKMYFGIGYETTHTLEQIGEKFNLVKERVRQIKEKGIRRLRHTRRSDTLREYL